MTKILILFISTSLFADTMVPKVVPSLNSKNLVLEMTPKFKLSNDANTGLYSNEKNSVSFARGGENVFTITTDGTLEFKEGKLTKEESTFVFMAVVKYLTEKGVCK